MTSLINKLKKIKKSQLAEAIPYVVSGSLLLFGCNNKENQKNTDEDGVIEQIIFNTDYVRKNSHLFLG